MSRNPAKKIIKAAVRKLPTAKRAAAPKFTTNPKKVSRLGLIPVAANPPTIRSSSHFPPVPIAPVNVLMVFTIRHDTATGGHIQIRGVQWPHNLWEFRSLGPARKIGSQDDTFLLES